MDGLSRVAYERRIERLEKENKELTRKLVDTSRTLQDVVHGPNNSKPAEESNYNETAEVKKLQEDFNNVTKKNKGLLEIVYYFSLT